MKTAEEILVDKNVGQNNTWLKSTVDKVEDAMEIYATQQSIAFAEWVGENANHIYENTWDYDGDEITSEILYAKFLSTLK